MKNSYSEAVPLLLHESCAVVHEGTREWARWNREMTRNTVVVAPPILGHRKMVAGEVQRRWTKLHGATTIGTRRGETESTGRSSSSPRS
jgi:hypothetical protein